MIRGVDVSTLLEVEAHGGRFYDDGREGDALEIMKRHGVNLVRLRIWNDPFSEDGQSYGAGGNDLQATLKLAERVRALGLPWMVDFQYSDFWADPGKQRVPKAWRGLNAHDMAEAVYAFTRHSLLEMSKRDLLPEYVQVGNEVTNGLLWPLGKAPNFENIALFISAGIRAVRETAPVCKVMIHLDNGGNNALYRDWFDSYLLAGGADFDLIGLSYYPFWHGRMSDLQSNMNDLARRYGKDMIIVETASGFTLSDYQRYEQLSDDHRKGMCATPALAAGIDYPMTPEGQKRFLEDLSEVIAGTAGGHGLGFVYWEPAWLPVPGSGWANDSSLLYIEEKGPGGNEWANLCLFDYEGNALPALKAISDSGSGMKR